MAEIYWLFQEASDLPDENDWLSDRERALLEKMKFPQRRGEWRLGRWTAKFLITSYFKIDGRKQYAFSEIEILPDENNAPRAFLHQNPLPFKISISHRAGAGFCVLQTQNHPIGCDLEIVEKRSDVFIRDYFTPHEYSSVMQAPLKDQSLIANLIWSAKESVLKALEQGLKLDTRSVEISPDDFHVNDSWLELRAASSEFNQEFYGWWRLKHKRYILTIFSTVPTEEPLPIQNI